MEDKDIIKALECCKTDHCPGSKCPLWFETTNTKHCITKISAFALELIKDQQAEIRVKRKLLEKAEVEIERLTAMVEVKEMTRSAEDNGNTEKDS